LDIKGPNLVKGIHLEGLRVLGKPEDFARYYYEAGADELIFMDVVASLYERNSLHEVVSRTAREIFIPLTVGGGLRTIDDIKEVLRAGADKVSLNTAALKNPGIIREASEKFGSSTITVAIEAIKQADGRYLAYTDNGREHTGVEVVEWAAKVEALGAGEIVITSVDREGTGEGYDLELTQLVSKNVSIPVIAHGGPGRKEQVEQVIKTCDVDAVAISSLFHYDYVINKATDPQQGVEGNIEFLKSGNVFKRIAEPVQINKLKEYLLKNGVHCRH
jgi:imidazole glycerol-phosphate synthase subunit HisF